MIWSVNITAHSETSAFGSYKCESEQEYIFFMGPPRPHITCYIHLYKVSMFNGQSV